MSNNKNVEPKFNEEQAYIELCNIIRDVIENGNFASLEPRIAIWENKYPLSDFTNPDIIRKIKTILNKDYLSRLVGDYLASQVLHEKQKQNQYYENLKQIIETAKKAKTTQGYEKAKKEVAQWKKSLYDEGFSIYDFDKYYTKKIFKMLLLPSQELLKQKEASESLKKLVESSKEMRSEELSNEISSWQNKHSLGTFPDDLKKELNSITADVFKSVSIKKSEESAMHEVQEYTNSGNMNSPVEEIPKLLAKYDYETFSDRAKSQISILTFEAVSLSELTLDKQKLETDKPILNYIPPLQQAALHDLKNIFSKNTHDMERLFEWIYLNRKIDFVPEAKDEIKALFSMAGFSKPTSGEYSIPALQANIKNLTPKDIEDVQEQVVLNYLGILYMDNKTLSTIAKDNISTIRDKHEVLSAARNKDKPEVTMVLPVTDNLPLAPLQKVTEPESLKALSKEDNKIDGNSATKGIESSVAAEVCDEDAEEINILIEDILKDPLESYVLTPQNTDNKDSIPVSFGEITTKSDNIETRQDDKEDIPLISTRLDDEQEVSTISSEVSPSLLSVEEQQKVEELNYKITSYYIKELPVQESELDLLKESSVFPEKNNGF